MLANRVSSQPRAEALAFIFSTKASIEPEPRKLYTTNYLISSYRTSYYLYKGAERRGWSSPPAPTP